MLPILRHARLMSLQEQILRNLKGKVSGLLHYEGYQLSFRLLLTGQNAMHVVSLVMRLRSFRKLLQKGNRCRNILMTTFVAI